MLMAGILIAIAFVAVLILSQLIPHPVFAGLGILPVGIVVILVGAFVVYSMG